MQKIRKFYYVKSLLRPIGLYVEIKLCSQNSSVVEKDTQPLKENLFKRQFPSRSFILKGLTALNYIILTK